MLSIIDPQRYIYVKYVDHVKPIVTRMLDAFEDLPVPLKRILLRPFLVYSRETADTIDQLYRIHSGKRWTCTTHFRVCSELESFAVLLQGQMTLEEKARHVGPLVDMFKELMTRHQSLFPSNYSNCYELAYVASRFVTLHVEVLRGAEGTSGELVQCVEYVMGKMSIELRTLLRRMDPNDVDYLLTCFSNVRFQAGGIRETDFLMDVMSRNKHMLSTVLIRHGFKFSFNQDYYVFCYRTLIEMGFRQSIIFHDAFINSGNLRMLMAVQILVHLHNSGEYGISRELICTLWESLPDLLITPDELYHLMEPFFVQGSLVLLDACARYRELFPGVPRVKQPRSLKHLARFRIREIMVRAHTLGERTVRSLGLPKTLEDYLWKLEQF